MKIAIITSGQPRFCAETDTFLKNLIGYTQADWYCYFWKNNADQHICGHNVVSSNWASIDLEWALNKFSQNLPANHRVVALELADYEKIKLLDPVRQPQGAYKMFRGNYQANLLRKHSTIDYDLIIRIRPDLGLLDTCDLREVKETLDKNPNSVIITHDRFYPTSGPYMINDWFAIARPDVMDTYCDAVNHVHNYNIEFTAETLLACHLIKNDISLIEGNFHVDVRFLGKTIDNRYQSDFGRWA